MLYRIEVDQAISKCTFHFDGAIEWTLPSNFTLISNSDWQRS